MQTVFEEDIKELREFVERAKRRELKATDVIRLSMFTSILIGGLTIIYKFEFYLGAIVFFIYFILSSILLAIFFMKRDLEEYSRVTAILAGICLWIITGHIYEWYSGWELDPTRVPWLQKWESPGFYIGAFIGLITGITVYKSIKKFYGGGKK